MLNSIKEKWSTGSNIFYIAVGLYLFSYADVMLILTGVSLLFLGVTSAGFHWTKSNLWQTLDISAIYATIWFMIYTIISFIFPEVPLFYIIPFALIASLVMGLGKKDFDAHKTVPILYLLLFVLIEIQFGLERAWTVTIVLLFAVLCQFVGEKKFPLFKDKFHALWHFFTAVGYFLVVSGF